MKALEQSKKLAEIAKPRNEIAKEKARFRKENRVWLRMLQEIAIRLHYCLRNNGVMQKKQRLGRKKNNMKQRIRKSRKSNSGRMRR